MGSKSSFAIKNDVWALRAFYAELIVFFNKKIEESSEAGLRSYAKIEVELFWNGAIHVFSSRAIASHHPMATCECGPSEMLMIDLEPFPRRGLLAGFSRMIQNRRLASLGKEGFFLREWHLLEKKIAVQEADLRVQKGIPKPPALAASDERRELAAMIPTPSKSAPKRHGAL